MVLAARDARRLSRRQLLLSTAALSAALCGGMTACAAVAPPAFANTTLAYDMVRQQLVLFGCLDDQGNGTATWTWDQRGWTLQHPTKSPDGRPGAALAYDGATERVVLFGGWFDATSGGHSGQLWDTWLWDGRTWADGPDLDYEDGAGWTAMAYDAARREVIRFGGQSANSGPGTGTWTLAGNQWTSQRSRTSPPDRTQAAMAYDAARQQIVLFGGLGDTTSASSPPLGDTWTWDGAGWTHQHPGVSPSPRWAAGIAYDPMHQQTVLFGGVSSGALADSWIWDGRTWAQRHVSGGPSARAPGGLAYDAARQRVVLFGGDTRPNSDASHYVRDTWTWDGNSWTQR